MKITCIAVDDESIARDAIVNYINTIEFLELVGVFKNAVQASNFLQKQEVDLIFLDIEMPLLSGIEFIKSNRPKSKVILTTAYSEYALESYEYDVVDYLVKPISFDRFLQAANKVLGLFSEVQKSDKEKEIFVKTDDKLVKVAIGDITYIESMQNYIKLHTIKEQLITLLPLKSVYSLLPHEDFVQVHKSFIVNRRKVDAIIGNEVIIGEHRIAISARMRTEVLAKLTSKRVLKK